jgi:hypothetical protein
LLYFLAKKQEKVKKSKQEGAPHGEGTLPEGAEFPCLNFPWISLGFRSGDIHGGPGNILGMN